MMMYVCGNSLTECCNLFSQQVSIPSLPIHSDATTTSKSTMAKLGEYSYVCVTLAWSVSYSNEYGDNSHDLFQDRRDAILRVNVEVLVPELKEHGILLDESIMSSLMYHRGRIDELHYLMYRLGRKENGLQIFYRCLRGTQGECPRHRRVADRIKGTGKNHYIIISTLSLVSTSSTYFFFV